MFIDTWSESKCMQCMHGESSNSMQLRHPRLGFECAGYRCVSLKFWDQAQHRNCQCQSHNLLIASDSGLLTILIPLNLPAAFDTISHLIPLNRLGWSGIQSTLSWFSYLSERSHFVHLKTFQSQPSPISSGVPQGSVLDTFLFISYILSLGNIFRKSINFHFCADDSQLYPSSKPTTTLPSSSLLDFVQYFNIWCFHNLFKFKAAFILVPNPTVLFQDI